MGITLFAMAPPKNLAEFIRQEIEKRRLSQRKFAELVGVSHRTIDKFLDENAKDRPSPAFLIKLGKATGTNILSLMVLAYPEMLEDYNRLSQSTLDNKLRSERIAQLPDNVRDVIDGIIFERARRKKDEDDV